MAAEKQGLGREVRRIQRKRTSRGWSLVQNAVWVGYPSKYLPEEDLLGGCFGDSMYMGWLFAMIVMNPEFLDDLKGKDLICWCEPNDPNCHAQLLMDYLKWQEAQGRGKEVD